MLYRCDPEKNTECKKTSCFLNGGPCKFTTKEEFKMLIPFEPDEDEEDDADVE